MITPADQALANAASDQLEQEQELHRLHERVWAHVQTCRECSLETPYLCPIGDAQMLAWGRLRARIEEEITAVVCTECGADLCGLCGVCHHCEDRRKEL